MPSDAVTVDEILEPSNVIHGLRVGGKSALLADLARRSGRSLGLDPDEILAALLRREGLGSTGVGDGVALPHARLDVVQKPYCVLARLRDPVEFDAVDDRPVDLIVLLLLPAVSEGNHLNALACVARRLRDPDTALALRGARDAEGLYAAVDGRPLSKA